jgi:D-sedoheptulose 7-phosphate isomerase
MKLSKRFEGEVMRVEILNEIENGIRAISFLKEKESLEFIEKAAHVIATCYQKEKKVIIAGNGGSLCDAMHFSEELSGFFREKRKALSAIAISEQGFLSCVANDVGYHYVFERAVEAHGKKGDVFISLTTSGNSDNLVNAVNTAKKMGLTTISFLGKDGGKQKGLSDLEWIVKGFVTSDRIQEAHMCAIHILIQMVEKILFGGKEKLSQIMKQTISNS